MTPLLDSRWWDLGSVVRGWAALPWAGKSLGAGLAISLLGGGAIWTKTPTNQDLCNSP